MGQAKRNKNQLDLSKIAKLEPAKKGKGLSCLSVSTIKDALGKKLKSFTINNEGILERKNECLVFSFILFDREEEAFNLGNVCTEWFVTLFDVLKDLSSSNWTAIMTEKRGFYDPHPHNWEKANYKFGFDAKTLVQNDTVQLRLGQGQGRIHAFKIGNRLYIYWLDRHHNMYDVEGHPGVQLYQSPKTCFDLVKEENIKLQDENKLLKKQLSAQEADIDDLLDKCSILEKENYEFKKAKTG